MGRCARTRAGRRRTLPAGPDLLTPRAEYATFVAEGTARRLYRGLGDDGEPLRTRTGLPLCDVGTATRPVVWACRRGDRAGPPGVERIRLPDLSAEEVPWPGGRIGALAASPDGERAAVVELPEGPGTVPRLRHWTGSEWRVRGGILPDVSSRVAWLQGSWVVCESSDRRLVLLDLDSDAAQEGPAGSSPCAASAARRWYALVGGAVAEFPYENPFEAAMTRPDGFDFGTVTSLGVTPDAQVFTWTEPRLLYRSAGYLQRRGEGKTRFRSAELGLGAVVGPFAFESSHV